MKLSSIPRILTLFTFLLTFIFGSANLYAQSTRENLPSKKSVELQKKEVRKHQKRGLFKSSKDHEKEFMKDLDELHSEAAKNALKYEKENLAQIKASGNEAGITTKYLQQINEFEGDFSAGYNPANKDLKYEHRGDVSRKTLKEYKASGKEKRQMRKAKRKRNSLKKHKGN